MSFHLRREEKVDHMVGLLNEDEMGTSEKTDMATLSSNIIDLKTHVTQL